MTITGGSLCLTGLGLKERKTIMKTLVLAEKPSVARDIARVLGCTRSLEGAIEGKDYVVTWGLGHLVELSDPEEYSDDYKEWRLDLLPMMPEPFRLTVIRQTARQFRAVKAQLFRKDVGQIVIATDAGREGELVDSYMLWLQEQGIQDKHLIGVYQKTLRDWREFHKEKEFVKLREEIEECGTVEQTLKNKAYTF